jgi:hypothetical protein
MWFAPELDRPGPHNLRGSSEVALSKQACARAQMQSWPICFESDALGYIFTGIAVASDPKQRRKKAYPSAVEDNCLYARCQRTDARERQCGWRRGSAGARFSPTRRTGAATPHRRAGPRTIVNCSDRYASCSGRSLRQPDCLLLAETYPQREGLQAAALARAPGSVAHGRSSRRPRRSLSGRS